MSLRSEVVRIVNEILSLGKKITALAFASTPLQGDELIEVVQSGTNKKVLKSDISSLPIKTFTQSLSFDTDKELEYNNGGTLSFTLSTGNKNGIGIILKLNKPVSVSFSADFEAVSGSLSFDATKLNIVTLIYFDNYDGSNGKKVLYSNNQLTGI